MFDKFVAKCEAILSKNIWVTFWGALLIGFAIGAYHSWKGL